MQTINFCKSTQELLPLRQAAYRLIGTATCDIRTADNEHYICALTVKPGVQMTDADLASRFCDLVTDENLRLAIAVQTSGIRNVILALAFGALAERHDGE